MPPFCLQNNAASKITYDSFTPNYVLVENIGNKKGMVSQGRNLRGRIFESLNELKGRIFEMPKSGFSS